MLKTITSVVCLSFTFVLFSNINPTQLAEVGLSLLEQCMRHLRYQGKDITNLTQFQLGALLNEMNTRYSMARYLVKYLSCSVNIRYHIETFTKHFLQVPEGFKERQSKINNDLNSTVYNRKTELGNLVKKFIKYYSCSTTDQDGKEFKQLWTKLKEFELYYPPQGKYDAIIPISEPISEDLKNLLVNLNTAENSEKALEIWTQDKMGWGQFVNQKDKLSKEVNNTLLELSLLSGSKLDDFVTIKGLDGKEHLYVEGMIQAGRSIRDRFVDKKYNYCFWTLYYATDGNLPALKKSLKQNWNLQLESEVVSKFCTNLVLLFDIVSTVDSHGVDIKLIPWDCQPESEDYKVYLSKISKVSKDLVPVVEFLLNIKYAEGVITESTTAETVGLTSLQFNNKNVPDENSLREAGGS